MLGIVTTISTVYSQPVRSLLELLTSTEYIINTDNITKMELFATDDSLIKYSLNIHDDQIFAETIIVTETNAAVQALSDVSPESNMILFPVYEGAITYGQTVGMTTTDMRFNVADVVWAEQNSSKNLSKVYIVEGGFTIKTYIVNYGLDQIMDVCDTGTTTTTSTSSTSTTSTSTSSTSTSSTSTTSTTTTPPE